MLPDGQIHPTIPATDLARARKFYEGTLGFKPVQEMPGGIIYQAGSSTWFILYPTQFAGTAKHTVASWRVKDIKAEVADLRKRGVVFEDYDFPGLKTVNGIAEMGEIKAAWFKDTENNILGIAQMS
jgi:catechol 2,3-dioxygenase-like lactoylglutathione lyase family enzyme